MENPQDPLAGLKVLDFSTLLPGPYATMLLADMGADVLRVESPTRVDLLNEMEPRYDERSYAHLTINRNKRSLALDLKHESARSIIHRLLQTYDVIVEQFRPGVMARLGFDYDSLKAINPGLIYCSITGYGQTGPLKDRAGHDINYLALGGLASYSGREQTGPVLSGTQIADIGGGSHHAVMAILAAVIARQKSILQQGSIQGQYLDISMSDATLSLNTLYGATALASKQDPLCGKEILNGGIFYDYYQTKDGRYISVGSLEPKFVAGFFSAIGHPEWQHRAAEKSGEQSLLKDDIATAMLSKNFDEWKKLFENLDVCVEPVLSISEAVKHPHFRARNMTCDVALENNHSIKQIASPIKFNTKPPEINAGKKLGADTVNVLTEIGYEQQKLNQLIEQKVVLAAKMTEKLENNNE